MRLWNYRVLDVDDDGDPLDHGSVTAATLDECQTLLMQHFTDLELAGWDGGRLRTRIYPGPLVATLTTPGIIQTGDPYVDVTLRIKKPKGGK